MSHLVLDIIDIRNNSLHCAEDLTKLMDTLCKMAGFNVLHRFVHEFEPEGITIMFALHESHMTLHTFPEKKRIAFDVYTCKEGQVNVLNSIRDLLVVMLTGVIWNEHLLIRD